MNHAFRLTRGMDLKKEIEEYGINNDISGVVLSLVGSLSKINLRLAGARDVLTKDGEFEIVSATGTISSDGVHIHISVSDDKGNVIGGHLKNDCIVDTTVEVVLLELKDIKFNRVYDSNTGYNELKLIKK